MPIKHFDLRYGEGLIPADYEWIDMYFYTDDRLEHAGVEEVQHRGLDWALGNRRELLVPRDTHQRFASRTVELSIDTPSRSVPNTIFISWGTLILGLRIVDQMIHDRFDSHWYACSGRIHGTDDRTGALVYFKPWQ